MDAVDAVGCAGMSGVLDSHPVNHTSFFILENETPLNQASIFFIQSKLLVVLT